jgi:hypothetical protein
MSKTTKSSLQQRIRSLIAGTQKQTPNESLTFGGATYTSAELVQILKSLDDATTGMDGARAKWRDAVTSQRAVKAKVSPVLKAYRSFLVAKYGTAVETLAAYGLTPHKAPAPRTSEQKAVAAAKRNATRTARHTMGAKQKQEVQGSIHAALVVTPAEGSAPTATPPAHGANATGGNATPRLQ